MGTLCPNCGEPTGLLKSGKGYKKYCSQRCNLIVNGMKTRITSSSLREKWKDSDYIRLQKEKFSKQSKQWWESPDYREMRSKASSEIMTRNWKIGAIGDEKWKEVHSILAVNMLQDPTNNFGSGYRKRFGKVTIYKGITFRSKLEASFAEALDSKNIDWLYEHKTFVIEYGKRYTPDFYILSKDLYVEIKSSRHVDECLSTTVPLQKLGIQIVVVTEKSMKKFINSLL